MAIFVNDLDDAYEKLRGKGLEFFKAPQNFDWGRSAYLRDPEGRLIELHQRPNEQ